MRLNLGNQIEMIKYIFNEFQYLQPSSLKYTQKVIESDSEKKQLKHLCSFPMKLMKLLKYYLTC
jgi:hypothetical protein